MILIALAGGVMLRLAWLALGLIRLRQITTQAADPAGISELFGELKQQLGANAELRITDDVDYSPAAMQQKIQGSVWLLAIVNEKGDVGEVEVSRSLDK